MSSPTVKRKLAAILAADAVGYSRMMGRDEERTMRVLSAHRAVIDGIIEFHDGRIIGTAGDSVLAEFASPVSAMRCAVEIQDALKTRNDSLPEADRMQFRIGINLGDVMIKGDDLLGDGVNVAARLEGIAEAGGICISSSVYDQLAGKMDLGFVEMGEQRLKNIQRPIRAYRVTRGVGVPQAARRGRAVTVALALLGLAAVSGLGSWLWLAAEARHAELAAVGREPAAVTPVAPAPEAQPAASAPRIEPAAPAPRIEPAAETRRVEEPRAEARRAADTRRVEEPRAEARRAADTRLADVEARARIEIAKERAAAEMERARADAAEMRRQAAAELAASRLPPTQPAAAVPQPAAMAPVQVATASPAPVAAPVPARWLAERKCDAGPRMEAFGDVLQVRFDGVEFVIERGRSGEPGYVTLRGTPREGRLAMTGHGIPGSGRNKGIVLHSSFAGAREGDGYSLSGTIGERPCTLTLSRH